MDCCRSFTGGLIGQLFGSMSATAGGSSPQVRSYRDAVAGAAGMKVLRFSFEEISRLSLPFRYALGFRGDFSVGAINVRHVFIKFALEKDYTKFWIKSIWFVEGFPMHVFKWISQESPIVPVWIRLPELPIQFIDREALFSIARLLGTPLRTDVSTATLVRPSVARVCVEINLLEPLQTEIGLGIGTEVIIQSVIYERLPKYCEACKHLGHDEDECYEKHKSKAPPVRPANRDDPPLLILDQEDLQVKLDAQRVQKNLRDRRKEEHVVFYDGAAQSRLGASTSGSKGAESECRKLHLIKMCPKQWWKKWCTCRKMRMTEKPNLVMSKNQSINTILGMRRQRFPRYIRWFLSWESLVVHLTRGLKMSKWKHVLCQHPRQRGELPNCVAVIDDEVLGPTVEDVHQVDEEDVSRRLARHRRGRSMGDASTDHSASPDRRKAVSPSHRIVTRRKVYGEAAGFHEVISNCVNQKGSGAVYAKCYMVERRDLWDGLRLISVGSSLWIVGGDFNIVLCPEERSGGAAPNGIAMSDFHYTIADCALIDAGYTRSPYTCWMNVFPKTQITHLELSKSDHRGLLVIAETILMKKASSFRFQHMWITHPGFLEVVHRNWQYPTTGSGMTRLQQKLTRLKHCLKEWNKTVFGNVFDRVAEAERDLKEADEAYDLDPCDRTLVERNRCSIVLVRVLSQEEAFWKQKVEIKWAKDGERNTRYFHSLVKKTRFCGTVFEIQHEGEVLTDSMAIKRLVASFFEELLSAEPVFADEMDRDCLEDGLTNEDRCFLCAMPMMAKVREAVFCTEPESAARPDGFGAIFYHTCWDLVSEDVFCAVSEFFHGIVMPKSFTATTISLIPKIASPTSWSEYRPISLCNVTNKICTKLMSIRLGHVLPKVISPSPNGTELVHLLESHRPEANVIFKLDMAKAYDRGDPLSPGVICTYLRDWIGFGGDLGRNHPYGRSSCMTDIVGPVILLMDAVEPLIFWTLGQGAFTGPPTIWRRYAIIGMRENRMSPGSSGYNGTFSTKSAWEAIRVVSPRWQRFTDIWHRSLRLMSVSHLFVEGAVVRDVWLHFANVWGNLRLMVHFWRYSTPFHSDLHIRTLIPFLILCSTWTQRNAAKYQGRQLRTLYAAQVMTSIQWKGDLHRALAMGFCFRPVVPWAPRVVRWSTPTPAWFKLNSDGSSLRNTAATAGVIRDEIGQLIAVWRGLELARAHSLAPIVLEVDATVVLQLLQSRVSGMWELQQELGSDLRHVFPEANGATDYLVEDAASRQLTRVMYLDHITGVLRGIIRLDKLGTPYFRRRKKKKDPSGGPIGGCSRCDGETLLHE
ncbi:UNVERIFIED_CONTAM: hypothetical protein Sindi_2889400 [Sesamum indicum]